jgi:hypothetical protein
LDFFLALLPITIIWNLQLDAKKKIGISILLGLGVLLVTPRIVVVQLQTGRVWLTNDRSGVAASIKTAYSKELGSHIDFSWDAWTLYAWST